MKYAVGDQVKVNEKAKRLPEHKIYLRAGVTGEVLEVDFENHRKNKQWVVVMLRGKSGNKIGKARFPSNWLDPV